MRFDMSEVEPGRPCARLLDDFGHPFAAASGRTTAEARACLTELVRTAFRAANGNDCISVLPNGVYISNEGL